MVDGYLCNRLLNLQRHLTSVSKRSLKSIDGNSVTFIARTFSNRSTEVKNGKITLIVVLPCILISTKLFCQQIHFLLKHKMLRFIFKMSFLIWLLHVSVPSDNHQGAYDGTLLKL